MLLSFGLCLFVGSVDVSSCCSVFVCVLRDGQCLCVFGVRLVFCSVCFVVRVFFVLLLFVVFVCVFVCLCVLGVVVVVGLLLC